MDFENDQWDLADKDLTNWLNGDNSGSNFPLSDILKSTYLIFRQKEISRLSQFCKHAFEYYQEQERIKLQKVYEFEHHEIRFRRIPLSESESRAKIQRENQKIINGIQSGDYNTFNDLYEYEFPKVVKLIVRNSGNLEMAQDVFQDAIIILMEKVNSQELELSCSLKTYLYSICKYLWHDHLRECKKEKLLIKFYDNEGSPEDILLHFYDTPDVLDDVATAIDDLGDPCKQLLECYYYKNMSWEDISKTLGYSNAASARNQKYKCLERVRKIVSVEN